MKDAIRQIIKRTDGPTAWNGERGGKEINWKKSPEKSAYVLKTIV